MAISSAIATLCRMHVLPRFLSHDFISRPPDSSFTVPSRPKLLLMSASPSSLFRLCLALTGAAVVVYRTNTTPAAPRDPRMIGSLVLDSRTLLFAEQHSLCSPPRAANASIT